MKGDRFWKIQAQKDALKEAETKEDLQTISIIARD